jgi:hypothetical protein
MTNWEEYYHKLHLIEKLKSIYMIYAGYHGVSYLFALSLGSVGKNIKFYWKDTNKELSNNDWATLESKFKTREKDE